MERGGDTFPCGYCYAGGGKRKYELGEGSYRIFFIGRGTYGRYQNLQKSPKIKKPPPGGSILKVVFPDHWPLTSVLRDIEAFKPGLFSTGISELKTGVKKTQEIRSGY